MNDSAHSSTPAPALPTATATARNAKRAKSLKWVAMLVQLDPADTKVALDQATANLAQAVRQVRTLYATNATLNAQLGVRQTDIVRAQTDLARATDDLNRRQSLVGNGAVSLEELKHAQSQVAAAQTALAQVHQYPKYPVMCLNPHSHLEISPAGATANSGSKHVQPSPQRLSWL